MPIRFSCAKCQTNFTVPDNAAGKTAKCKSCGQPIKIPNQSTVGGNPAAKANATSMPTASGAAKPKAMYEITSGINGAVFGPADRKTLEQWVKEDRITPACKIKQVGTSKWVPANRVFASLREADPTPQASDSAGVAAAAPTGNPSGGFDVGGPVVGAAGAAAGSDNPFAALGEKKKQGGGASIAVNPYASAGVNAQRETALSGEVNPRSGDIGFIINHSFKRYGEEFGTLLGATAMILVCFIGLGIALFGILFAVAAGGNNVQMGPPRPPGIAFVFAGIVVYVIYVAVTMYLSIGMMRLMLKIGRGEEAQVTDVFNAGDRFLPVLGFGLMTGTAVGIIQGIFMVLAQMMVNNNLVGGMEIAIISLVGIISIVFTLAIWPCYFLVVDKKAKVFQAYPLGFKIGLKNFLQSFVIFLIAGIVYLAGALLFGVGIIFSLPIAMLIVAVAYLNMSGQISATT